MTRRTVTLRRRYSDRTEQVGVRSIGQRFVTLTNGWRLRAYDTAAGRAGTVVGAGQPSAWYVRRGEMADLLGGRRGERLRRRRGPSQEKFLFS